MPLHPRKTNRVSRWWPGLLVSLLVGCAAEPPPSLVLISVDTLRPDRLGFAGHERPTTPTLDVLAAQAVVFENAYSPAGWTLPSMASVMTGRRPREHGATSYDRAIAPSLPTLAELLRASGYDTRAFVSHVLLGESYGFGRGFDVFDASVLDVGAPHELSTATPLTERVLAELARAPLGSPYFLWVHYFDPHFKYLKQPEGASFGRRPLDRYDGEVAHTDAQIARLLGALRAQAGWDDAIVVFTSDHGEEFREHGGRFHETLYDEVLRVPLLIRAPGIAPGARRDVALLSDLLPTLIGRLGVDPPDGLNEPNGPDGSGGAGRDLFEAAAAERPLYFERDLPLPFRQRGVRVGDRKLVVIDVVSVEIDPEREAPGKTEWKPPIEPGIALYDLAADPKEQTNLYDPEDPAAQALMSRLLARFDEGVGPENRVPVDEELLEQLRDLGYLR